MVEQEAQVGVGEYSAGLYGRQDKELAGAKPEQTIHPFPEAPHEREWREFEEQHMERSRL